MEFSFIMLLPFHMFSIYISAILHEDIVIPQYIQFLKLHNIACTRSRLSCSFRPLKLCVHARVYSCIIVCRKMVWSKALAKLNMIGWGRFGEEFFTMSLKKKELIGYKFLTIHIGILSPHHHPHQQYRSPPIKVPIS